MNITRYSRNEDMNPKWYTVDAAGKTLGRLATEVATVLRGKNKVFFNPNVDCGDYVIVINAEKVILTGNKWSDKIYYSYSGYQGGLKSTNAKDMVVKHPEYLVTHAVKGMLPKNKLARKILDKLKVYAGETHPHTAQEPEVLDI